MGTTHAHLARVPCLGTRGQVFHFSPWTFKVDTMPKKTTRVGLRLVKPTPRRAHPGRTGLDWVQKVIKLENIGPSPYQRRRYFDEDKLKELAASIQ